MESKPTPQGNRSSVRTVAIILGDNDFGNTFQPLLESLYRAIQWHGGELSKEAVRAALRAGIEFHYLVFQHGRTFGQPGYLSTEDVVTYLSGVRILFDEEAETDIATEGHDSGAWYLEVQSGNVSYY